MITLKRSDLSPVPAINTPEKERQGYWISDADTERGRGREKEVEMKMWAVTQKCDRGGRWRTERGQQEMLIIDKYQR